MELVEKMTDDTKQAVRELREALNKAPRRSEPRGVHDTHQFRIGKLAIELLPAVLDRLEELEWENTMLKLAEKPVYSRRKLIAERDAIRAKFAEFRAAVERIFQYGDSVLDVLDRFPIDSSETTDGREG